MPVPFNFQPALSVRAVFASLQRRAETQITVINLSLQLFGLAGMNIQRLGEVGAIQIRQSIVGARIAPFIQETAITRGDQTAPAVYEAAHSSYLPFRHHREIRQDKDSKLRRIPIDLIGVNR